MNDPTPPVEPPRRGRPRTRHAERNEQVKQNMRLYRARRQAELAALGRALDGLLASVESGDTVRTFGAAAAVSGIWKESTLRNNVLEHEARVKSR